MQVCAGLRTGIPVRRASDKEWQVRHYSSCLLVHLVLIFLRSVHLCVCPAGCQLLQELELNSVEVDGCGDAQSAAEGAMLGLFHFDQLKSKKKTKVTVQLHGRYPERALLNDYHGMAHYKLESWAYILINTLRLSQNLLTIVLSVTSFVVS